MTAVLDTHAAIWYLHRSRELSSAALRSIRRAIEGGEPVYVSVISLVETIYLVERGRLPLDALRRLEAGLKDPVSGLLPSPWMRRWPRRCTKCPATWFPRCRTASLQLPPSAWACPSSPATGELRQPESRPFGKRYPANRAASQPYARRRHRRLAPRVPRADYNHVVLFIRP